MCGQFKTHHDGLYTFHLCVVCKCLHAAAVFSGFKHVASYYVVERICLHAAIFT